ncbi:o-succinylbenzoate synthase [Saccharicrinis fermentans]|uniref:o-succinylbenzoate synthase n=1 Tax=Saccharicrinis fermentans TaxID=982 RepID=UPI0004ACD740|nr:o-succinylbenzoate synthase [Saccharicrinis fermentans]
MSFNTPGGTSRGVLKTKNSWYVEIYEQTKPDVVGIGECSILPRLSVDDKPHLESKLTEVCEQINIYAHSLHESLTEWPAIRFALEMALLDLQNGGGKKIFHSDFVVGMKAIPINGLIWMGEMEYMQEQLEQKLKAGFDCIKIKVGALDFKKEIELIKEIRRRYDASQIEVRVDANGAFSPDEALDKMIQLSKLDIHSIEQPIKAGQWQVMADLCKETPLPIALDEELIGLDDFQTKEEMLSIIKPQYVILKPSLLGGFKASDEWVRIAEAQNVGWWATSALEGNVGLNAIAQWTAIHDNSMPQGLGTGQVFSNNVSSPLEVKKGHLFYNINEPWGVLPEENIIV